MIPDDLLAASHLIKGVTISKKVVRMVLSHGLRTTACMNGRLDELKECWILSEL